jgi:hypothetical protein
MKPGHCYCAFCRLERRVYLKRHISAMDAFLAAITSLMMSFVIWQTFDPRAALFFAFCLGVGEIFILFRWRFSIACPHCGFDPILYKRDHEAAASRVKTYMRNRRNDPLSVFNPPPKLPSLVRKASNGVPKQSAKKAGVITATKGKSTKSIRA